MPSPGMYADAESVRDRLTSCVSNVQVVPVAPTAAELRQNRDGLVWLAFQHGQTATHQPVPAGYCTYPNPCTHSLNLIDGLLSTTAVHEVW